jgi:hypothetical protein
MRRPVTAHALRAIALLAAPLALFAATVGCPKKSSSGGAAPATSTNAPAPASASSVATIEVTSEPSAGLDAQIDDENEDASVAAMGSTDAAPAGSGDAHADGDAKSDAKGDAKSVAGAKKLDDEFPVKGVRKITTTNANVHRAPKDGVTMTVLPKGTEVKLVAQYFDWYRVRYTDPQTGEKRQGWVYLINFLGPRRKSCPEGWTYHFLEDGGWCEKECSKKTDCKGLNNYKCSGGQCYYAGD